MSESPTPSIPQTLQATSRLLASLGMTISKRDGEYRVNFKGGTEETAYYTPSIEDAIGTAKHMAQERARNRAPLIVAFDLKTAHVNLLSAHAALLRETISLSPTLEPELGPLLADLCALIQNHA